MEATKYRIIEQVYDDGSRSFQAQYFIGEDSLAFCKEVGYLTKGWIDIGEKKDTYRKSLLKINMRKKSKFGKISIIQVKDVVDKIIHEIR